MGVVPAAPELLKRTIVAEVVESEGCNSRHRVGERFYFDGIGQLLTDRSPKRICMGALAPLYPLGFAAGELLYAGADPNAMRFKRTHCFDVGVRCGGWGRVVLEVRVE